MRAGDGGASEEAGICGASLASPLRLLREAPVSLEVLKGGGTISRGFGTGQSLCFPFIVAPPSS